MSDNDNHNKKEEFKSALHVQEGIEQPESINPNALKKFRLNKKTQYSVDEYVQGILDGNITILGQAITLVESSLVEHNRFATEIVEKCTFVLRY